MSRIGRLPITIPEKVQVKVESGIVTVTGPLGTLSQEIANENILVEVDGKTVHVKRLNEQKATKAAHGLYRALISNMVTGVSKGFEKRLLFSGVGYKAQMQGTSLVLNVGYSHPVTVPAPEGIKIAMDGAEIVVSGIDKTAVGQCAASIKAIRRPEPYHGYGIRYKDEVILRKEGKTAGK